MKEEKKDKVYGIIMILFLVVGVFCGYALGKQTLSVKECNDFFIGWINNNCECTDEIRDAKLMDIGDWTMQMEVPLLNETRKE